MPQIAFIHNFIFDFEHSFDELSKDKITAYLNDKLEFIDINSTADLLSTIQHKLNQSSITVQNCKYDVDNIIQQIYYNSGDDEKEQNMLLVKRQLKIDDTYTFMEYDGKKPENDIYKYLDISLNEVIETIRNKYIHQGVIVKTTGEFEQIEYLDKNLQSKNFGVLNVIHADNNIDTIRYIRLENIISKHNKEYKDVEDEKSKNILHKTIVEKTKDYKCEYLFSCSSKKNFALHYYTKIQAEIKNEIISKYEGENVFGDIVIGLENTSNSDEFIFNLNINLMQKILQYNDGIKQKDKYYFNIYKELL